MEIQRVGHLTNAPPSHGEVALDIIRGQSQNEMVALSSEISRLKQMILAWELRFAPQSAIDAMW